MHLSWNEIRARAAKFATDWKDARYESGETQSFYNDFFEVFGVSRRRVASYEEPVRKLGNQRGFIDLFWKGVLLVEQKSAGRDLAKAKQQALEYFPGLRESELPRYLLVSDFQSFELYDLDEGTELRFSLSQFPDRVQAFAFILGIQKRTFRDQDPVNIEASELMGKLHDALAATGYKGHDLERLLVRLLFCMFADDTGIFEPRDIFHDLLSERTREDGSDVGQLLANLFEVLNTPVEDRPRNLDQDLAQFPYVNGDLFRERLRIPSFDTPMRALLIFVCGFTWDKVSPAIFGALFQSVMTPELRRAQGGHYTTEKNILKVISPLFLDELHDEFERLRQRRDSSRRKVLEAFHEKLAGLRFFDPACGCGNFLVITYRELRALEITLLEELFKDELKKGQLKISSVFSKINVDQFYGIEINEFAVRIAEVALWMMDHIMNNRLSLTFGEIYTRIPLTASPHIHDKDALEVAWDDVLPRQGCSFVLGNPPFGGAKFQSGEQRAQVRRVAQLGGSGGTLDYVAAWFIRAAEYIQGTNAKIGFVATNSITQGEQVGQLWPILFDRYQLEIAFAHRTFAWGSDVRGVAHVHVVVIGLALREQEPAVKRLFNYEDLDGEPLEGKHEALTAYLFDARGLADPHLVVAAVSEPLCHVPKLIIGSKPIDDGQYIFDDEQRQDFLRSEPDARPLMRPFVGTTEFLYGSKRWILTLHAVAPERLRAMPEVKERIARVRKFRLESKSPGTQALAATEFHVTVIPNQPFLVVPEVSSERREYVPIGWLEPPVVPSNLVKVLLDAELWHFGILTSRMHMAWLRHVGGRLESRYRYSAGIVYNNFPWPEMSDKQRQSVASLAQDILDARARFPRATLADLYDSDVMQPELVRAHRALDKAVDRLYRSTQFISDRERVEHLFVMYEELIRPPLVPVTPTAPKKSKRRKQ